MLHKLVMLMRSRNLKLVWEHTLMNKYLKNKNENLQFKIERVVYFSYRNMQSRVRVVDLYIKRTKKCSAYIKPLQHRQCAYTA
jgi:hypothetical protein